MLKTLFWLLLTINAAMLAWGQGLFAAQPVQRREPQRLAQQLHPEQLILTTAPVAATDNAPGRPAVDTAAPALAAVTTTATAPAAAVAAAGTAVPAAPAITTAATTPATTPASATAATASAAGTQLAAPTTAPQPVPGPLLAAASVVPAGAVGARAPIGPATTPIAPVASIVPPLPASSSPVASCVDIGNFEPAGARLFRTRLNAAHLGARAISRNVQEVSSHMVYIPAQEGRAGAERKAAELRRLGITDFYVMPESSALPNAISLGLFKTEAAAKARIGALIGRGVRSARIMARTASTDKLAFRLRDLNSAELAALTTLAAEFPLQTRRECAG